MDVIKLDDTPNGIDTILHIEDGELRVERKHDAQPILDSIRIMKQVTDGKSQSGEMFHAGRIPSIVIEKYCNEKGITFREFILDDTHVTRILNDSNYARFRIFEGRV